MPEPLRKLLHASGAVLAPVAVFVFGWTGAVALAVFLLVFFYLGWWRIRKDHRLPVLAALVGHTSREGDDSALDALEYVLAVAILGLLLPLPYFFASVALLAFGDTAASIAGRRWGRRRLSWNPAKSWTGLLVGSVVGVAAYVTFAIVGGQMQSLGFAEANAFFGDPPAWWSLAFIAGVFPGAVVFAILAYPVETVVAVDAIPIAWRRRLAQAAWGRTLVAFAIAFLAASAVAWFLPQVTQGPLLPTQGGHDDVLRRFLPLAAIAGMVAESFARRHDNLIVPGVSAAFAYALVAASNRF